MTNPYDDLVVRTTRAATAPAANASANPYDSLVANLPESGDRLKQSAIAASNLQPDTAARAQRVAGETGLPAGTLARNPTQLDRLERQQRLDRVRRSNPALADWLAEPARMAVAQDDIDGLDRLGAAVQGPSMRATTGNHERSWGEFFGDMGLQFKQMARLGVVGLSETPVNAVNLVNRQFNNAARGLAGLFGEVPESEVGMLQQPEVLREFRADTEALNAAEFEQGASFKLSAQQRERPTSFFGALRYMATNPSVVATDLAGVGGTMVSGIVPGSTAATLGAQAGSQASMAAADVAAALKAKGYSDADAQAAATDAFGWAAAAGVVIPRLTPGGTAFEGAVAGQATRMAGSPIRRAGVALVGEPVSEMAEEGAVQVAQNVYSNENWDRGVGGAMAQGLVAGTGMGVPGAASQYTAGRREQALSGEVARLFSSAGGSARLSAMGEAARATKLGERSPDALGEFARAAGATGHVYLQAEQARVLFQSDFDLASLVGGQDALVEQVNAGDLVIPMDRWLSVVSRLPNAAEIERHARLRADDLSAAELEGFDADAELARLGFVPDTEEAGTRAEAAEPDSRQRITDDVLGQLLGTGRYSQSTAEAQASLWGAAFTRFGELAGQDPLALFQRYMGGINDGTTSALRTRRWEGSAQLDAVIDAVRSGAEPDAAAMNGPSLLAFLAGQGGIQDQGGELKARDATKLRPGLVRKQGLALDRARELAAEAGYIPADTDLGPLLDAIDAELRGAPVYSEANRDQVRSQFDLDRQLLLQAIEETPALRDMPAEQFNALTNQQIAEVLFGGATFDQAPAPGSQAFRQWFGDSKVVDAQGKPLVVYHGTAEDFTAFEDKATGTATGHATAPLGHFFTGNRDLAQGYAENAAQGVPADERVIEAYLSIRQPYEMTLEEAQAIESPEEAAAIRQWLQQTGHDGIHIAEADNWIAFESRQVKAVDNRGTFDAASPNIYNQPAYHGTPHTVERFSLQRIGTGEGNQSYGWGLYFASQREVAESYRAALSEERVYLDGEPVTDLNSDTPEGSALSVVSAQGYERSIKRADEVIEEVTDSGGDVEWARRWKAEIEKLKDRKVERRLEGKLYQVEVPEDSDLLDWDAPLSEQPAKVRDLVRDIFKELGYLRPKDNGPRQFTNAVKALEMEFGKNSGGAALYRALAKDKGGPQGASEYLLSIGIPGLRYLDGDSRADGEGSHNYVIWDESAVSTPEQVLDQSGETAPRGQIRIAPDRSMSISLFEKADRTTFLHESGHFFFEVFADIATAEDAPQQARDDFAALLAWFGVESREQVGTEQHEQFARGFEAYLGEGKAPTPALQSVFGQFKAWVLSIYKTLRNLNVTLTDDVRGVFDRMLATEEEIEAAQVRQGMQPLVANPSEAGAIGLTDKQFADYQAMVAAATEEARADVMAKLMKAYDRARQAWWKEESAKVREEVEAEYESRPVVRAFRILSGTKKLDGAEVPEALRVKLDKAALVASYGEAYLKRLGRTYARSGGLHPDEAARLFGFPSGDALVSALANVPDTLARVDAEVADRMRERHGDPLTDGTLGEVAMEAVHNSKRVQVLEYELALLQALAADPTAIPQVEKPASDSAPRERKPMSPETRARVRAAAAQRSTEMRKIKAAAKALVDRKTARQLRPNDYLAAERRAAREATQAAAKGDYAAALLAKRQQALNVSLYAEARAAVVEFEKHERYLRKFTQGDKRAQLGKAGADYLEQVDQLLEGLEVKAVSGAEVARRLRLSEWVARQEAEGRTINVPVKLLEAAGLTNIRDLPLADLRDVINTIKQIDHLATLKNKLLLAGELRDRIEVDIEMADSVRESLEAKPERTGDKRWHENLRKGLAVLDVGRLLPTNIARELDGYRDGGAVWRHVIQPIRDAVYGQVLPAVKSMQDTVAGIYRKHYTTDELRRLDDAVFRPEVGDTWSKGRVLSLAMHWGSNGNREAILSQAHSRLTEEQAVGLLRTLDARDWAFVQDVVDHVNSYWPQIAETQRRRTGLTPEKVEPQSFVITTADGQMIPVRGGYFPLKYDAERSGYGATREEIDDIYNDLRIGRTAKASTRNGHTIERVGSGGRTVKLGLELVESHLRDVIRDVHLGDAVAYVHQTMNGKAFTEAAIAAGKREHLHALELWLKDVAAGELGARSGYESVVRFVRQNTTASVLAWKVTSAGLQFTGLVQTASVIGRRATLRGLTRLLSKSWIGPNSIWNEIRGKSAYMAERFGKIPDAVQVVADARAGRIKAGHAAMIRWGYVPMARMQMIADGASWLAAEAVGLRKFDGDVAKARAFADDIVTRAQSPDNFIDKPAVSRGTLDEKHRQSELVKASTMLLSYMIAKGNVAREKYQQTRFTSPLDAAKFSVDMVQLFFVEAAIMALVKGGLPDDDEDDGLVDDWAGFIGKEVGLGFVATIPLLSQAATEGRGYTAQGVLERAWSTADDATGKVLDGELNRKDAKALVSLAGLATGAPSSQINTTADALWRVRDGEDVAPVDFLIRPEKK